MTMLNEFNANKKITKKEYRIFLQLLNPFAASYNRRIK